MASPLLAGFATVCVFIAGNLHSQLTFLERIATEKNIALAWIIKAFRVVLPNFEALNLSHEFTYHQLVPSLYVSQAVFYTLTYSMIALLIAVLLFSRKDLG